MADLFTRQDLKTLQSWTLAQKIQVTQARIIEWWRHYEGKIYISFSGGKDSTVLADLTARVYEMLYQAYPDTAHTLNLAFANTGLEYPEIREFVPKFADWLRDTYGFPVNLETVAPKRTFRQVVEEYGYPVISKEIAKNVYYFRKGAKWAINKFEGLTTHGEPSKFLERNMKYKYLTEAPFGISAYCCDVIKKQPLHAYEARTGNKPIIAIMACESQQRESGWLKSGCNSFENEKSQPMSFWTEQDVLRYLKETKTPYAPVYGEIVERDKQQTLFDESEGGHLVTTDCERTGCMFCMFGITLDREPNRFQRMKQTHRRLYDYCTGGGAFDEGGVWKPDKNGLGIGRVLDYIGVPY
jgi:3'-phosphoadenosine 5'-phosphosulfate sulfotransferase (PAPS reductase)/FAD synthetase